MIQTMIGVPALQVPSEPKREASILPAGTATELPDDPGECNLYSAVT